MLFEMMLIFLAENAWNWTQQSCCTCFQHYLDICKSSIAICILGLKGNTCPLQACQHIPFPPPLFWANIALIFLPCEFTMSFNLISNSFDSLIPHLLGIVLLFYTKSQEGWRLTMRLLPHLRENLQWKELKMVQIFGSG